MDQIEKINQSNLQYKTLRMLRLKQLLASSRNSVSRMAHYQCFSVLFINNKELDAPAFDVLIQDFDQKELHNKISSVLNKQYLCPLKENQKQFEECRTGLIYGGGLRGIISLPTRTKETQPIWIHYLIDTGSPYTFLTKSALKSLKVDETQNLFSIYINSHKCTARLSHRNFEEVNLLGMNFIENRSDLIYNLKRKIVQLIDQEKA